MITPLSGIVGSFTTFGGATQEATKNVSNRDVISFIVFSQMVYRDSLSLEAQGQPVILPSSAHTQDILDLLILYNL